MNRHPINSRRGEVAIAINTMVVFVFCLTLATFPTRVVAANASFYLSPITGVFTTEEPVIIRVMVGTGGEEVNALEGKILFDPKEVEVVEIDRTNSLLSSWTQIPVYDNAAGEIVFAGGMSGTSSFSGERGEVIALTIRGLRSTESRIQFDSGSASAVHAADGTGGNLLSVLSSGVYVFSPKETTPIISTESTQGIPPSQGEVLGAATGTSVITSPSHPDQRSWYNNATATLQWEVIGGVDRILLSLNSRETGRGIVGYDPGVHEKIIPGMQEGISYVHLTREYSDGGERSEHYRFQIDLSPPSGLTVSEESRMDVASPRVVFTIVATDTLSGIDRYEITVDGGTASEWKDDGSHHYILDHLKPGNHELLVAAVDRAGNRSPASRVQFSIEFLPTPTLVLTESSLKEGGSLVISATGIPNGLLHVSIARDGGTPVIQDVMIDPEGKAQYTGALVLTPGVYQVWAIVSREDGAISEESEHLSVVVTASAWGVLKRHPFIPVVLIAIVILLGIARVFWKKFSRNTPSEDETVIDTPEADHREETPLSRTTQRIEGAVVLKNVSHRNGERVSATRL